MAAVAFETHARIGRELAAVAEGVLPGTAVADRRLSEALVRVIGIMLRLHEEHAPDGKRRCGSCGRRPCPIQAVSAIYVPRGDRTATAAEPAR